MAERSLVDIVSDKQFISSTVCMVDGQADAGKALV
jgi:hypothetical protein